MSTARIERVADPAAPGKSPALTPRRGLRTKPGATVKRSSVLVIQALVVLLVVGGWAIGSATSGLVAGIGVTLQALVDGFRDGEIGSALASTSSAVGMGFVIAAAIGLTAGMFIGRSPYWYRTMEPLIAAGFAVPRIVLYPVLLVIFGLTLDAKIALFVLSAVFPIVASTMAGVREVNPVFQKLARSLGMSRWQTVRIVLVPAAAPTIIFGLRIGLSVGLIGVILAEMFGAVDGLGVLIARSYAVLDLPAMYAVIVLIVVLATLVNLLLWRVERWLQHNVE